MPRLRLILVLRLRRSLVPPMGRMGRMGTFAGRVLRRFGLRASFVRRHRRPSGVLAAAMGRRAAGTNRRPQAPGDGRTDLAGIGANHRLAGVSAAAANAVWPAALISAAAADFDESRFVPAPSSAGGAGRRAARGRVATATTAATATCHAAAGGAV